MPRFWSLYRSDDNLVLDFDPAQLREFRYLSQPQRCRQFFYRLLPFCHTRPFEPPFTSRTGILFGTLVQLHEAGICRGHDKGEWRRALLSGLLSLDSVLLCSLHPETPFRGSLAAGGARRDDNICHGDFRPDKVHVDVGDPSATPLLIDFTHVRAHKDDGGECPGVGECDALCLAADLLHLSDDSSSSSGSPPPSELERREPQGRPSL